jgi:hypothetical protein
VVQWSVCCKKRANDHPGGAIVRFLSRFGTLETSSAIDRPGGAIVRFLSRFGASETSSAIDRPGGAIVRTTEEMKDCCRDAKDRTRGLIVRSYIMEPVELNVKLEQKKLELRKLKIRNKTQMTD